MAGVGEKTALLADQDGTHDPEANNNPASADVYVPLASEEKGGDIADHDDVVEEKQSAVNPPKSWQPSYAGVVLIALFSFACRAWLPVAIGLSKNGAKDLLYNAAFVVALAETWKFGFTLFVLPLQYQCTPKHERAIFKRFDCKTFFLFSIPALCYQASK